MPLQRQPPIVGAAVEKCVSVFLCIECEAGGPNTRYRPSAGAKYKEIFSPKQVGQRVKERRTELGLSMPELGKRISVNKSTIQRYEADGVDPKRTMVINGLAEALLTTPEWLTGLSDDKEYNSYTVCQMELEKHIKSYLETVTSSVKGEPHQQLLTTFLGQLVDLYAILTKYWAISMKKVDEVAEDEVLKESIGKYAIHIGSITEQVYQKEMEVPVEDMKRYLDGILHFYDEGRTQISVPKLLGMVEESERRLAAKEAEQRAKGT
ncbi:helix-turn-helix domain-containing protein [Synergistes jonesii]|uniref:helix-turn-helix domain-containing protein n=1 Tax=Synergistes jonesii TaxID=2754 RepID=UPI001C404144|nr:helix-turn-helix transcriptional regulator [Synergistes jonesii]